MQTRWPGLVARREREAPSNTAVLVRSKTCDFRKGERMKIRAIAKGVTFAACACLVLTVTAAVAQLPCVNHGTER